MDIDDKLTDKQKEFYNVQATEQENLKIASLLQNADTLNISDEDAMGLQLTRNRNDNFLFVNMERWGGDSPLMTKIKRGVAKYESAIDQKYSDSNFDEMVENQNGNEVKVKKHHLADFAVSVCSEVIANCETYLQRGKSWFFWRHKRYEAVQKLKERMKKEKARLEKIEKEDFKQSFDEDLKETDRLKDLINLQAIKGRKKGRLKKIKEAENQVRNEALKQQVNDADASFMKKKNEAENGAKAILKMGKEDGNRTYLNLVAARKLYGGYTDEQNAEFYQKISKNMSFCTEEEKKEKTKCMEDYFDTLLSFDITELNFDKLEDLFSGSNFVKMYAVIQGGMDCEPMMREYEAIMEENPELCNFTKEKLARAEARRVTLQQASSWWINLKEILNSDQSKGKDLEELLKLPYATIEKMESEADGDDDELSQFYIKVKTILEYSRDPDTGEKMFGPEMDIRDMEAREIERARKKYGV
ncbi:MAG: hypothetical protein IJT05_06365 [Lachnospiraceae bacterium]|nr:hypothetical protein [Lachnospiraceae bacterium]